jgi:hypothetical protein
VATPPGSVTAPGSGGGSSEPTTPGFTQVGGLGLMHGESRASFRQPRRSPQGEAWEGCCAGTTLRCRALATSVAGGHGSNPVVRRKPEFMTKPKGASGFRLVATRVESNGLFGGESPEAAATPDSSETGRANGERVGASVKGGFVPH